MNRFVLAVMALLPLMPGSPAGAQTASAERVVPSSRVDVQYSYAPVVKRVAPAVVNIFSKRVVRVGQTNPFANDPFFRQFFGDRGFGVPRERVENSLGSGVIVRGDGVIVTSNHVIAGADEITVVLADRREFPARIVLTDERTDLAILRIDAGGEQLPKLDLADSDRVEVGDIVLAVGNPFGVGQTVTTGIVSGLARTQVGITDFNFFIQTDAAINPGNSGGALAGLDGRLIGINTAIFSRSGGSQGIGFAIPSSMVRTVLDGALSGGRVVRPWLGVSGQAVTPDIAQSLGLPRPAGVLVKGVHPDSAGAKGGLKVGDVITGIDGLAVEDPEALNFRMATRQVGGKARMEVLRDGRSLTFDVALTAAPESPPRDLRLIEGRGPFAGVRVGNLSPAFADEMGVDTAARGVIVVETAPGSPAARLGLRKGDVIVALNGAEVGSTRDLETLAGQRQRAWRVTIRRDGREIEAVVRG
ncbi:DegQ family serine endoprotease [Zavarzinia sp. CC-PAN008]|uniref:DegQ family serine endoprotease n=1 Tax=Zavarzinia sp. CC-PAN008 TaxID=3243332 RepID=UPI003F74277B